MFKVIDNFLTEEENEKLINTLESRTFPWFYVKGKVKPTSKPKLFDYQFTHIFYAKYQINSHYFNHIEPILNKLKP